MATAAHSSSSDDAASSSTFMGESSDRWMERIIGQNPERRKPYDHGWHCFNCRLAAAA